MGSPAWSLILEVLSPQDLEVPLSLTTVYLALVMTETQESSCHSGTQFGHISENELLVKPYQWWQLFLRSLLFTPPLCLSHRCLWLPAWEWD